MEVIKSIIDFTVTTYWGVLFWLCFGLYMIYDTLKNPQKEKYSVLQGNMKGWAAGIMGILLSIFIFVMKLLGKL